MRASGHFGTKTLHENLMLFKNLYEFYQFFLCYFLAQNVSMPPDQNSPIPLDKDVFIFLNVIYNMNIWTVWPKKLYMKTYLGQNVLIPRILLIHLDQSVSILLMNNMYIGNIKTVWHRKLYIKTWFSSKSLWILSIIIVFFGDKMP